MNDLNEDEANAVAITNVVLIGMCVPASGMRHRWSHHYGSSIYCIECEPFE